MLILLWRTPPPGRRELEMQSDSKTDAELFLNLTFGIEFDASGRAHATVRTLRSMTPVRLEIDFPIVKLRVDPLQP